MTVRPPRQLASRIWTDNPAAALDYEIAQEKASTLGRLGRGLERALDALRAFDAQPSGDAAREQRRALVGVGWHAALAQEPKLGKPRIALSVGGSVSQMNKIAYFVALNKKYFEQEGLTVDPTNFASGTAALQNLIGGNADVVEGSFEH